MRSIIISFYVVRMQEKTQKPWQTYADGSADVNPTRPKSSSLTGKAAGVKPPQNVISLLKKLSMVDILIGNDNG